MTARYGLLLDPVTGDLPDVWELAADSRYVVQSCVVACRTQLGEWFADVTRGLPLIGWLTSKPVNLAAIEAAVSAELATVNGVSRVIAVRATLDPATSAIVVEASILIGVEPVTIGATLTPAIGGNAGPAIGVAPGF